MMLLGGITTLVQDTCTYILGASYDYINCYSYILALLVY